MIQNSKILIVDDEPDILEFIWYNLSKEGFEVQTAKNGEEALTVAEEFEPDLILLDIMMPKMGGVEVCHELRKKPKFKDTIIAFLTARNEDYTQISAFEEGGDDYITKPIKPKVLISRLKALLKRLNLNSGTNANQVIKAGDLKIDKDAFMVYKNGIAIDFAKKEFELLYLLATKPGRVFRREEIYIKVWGEEVIVGNRTIDVHIRKIREKIGDMYIKTVKGIGYKFEF